MFGKRRPAHLIEARQDTVRLQPSAGGYVVSTEEGDVFVRGNSSGAALVNALRRGGAVLGARPVRAQELAFLTR